MRSPGIEEKENVHHLRTVIDIRSNDPCVQDKRGDCPLAPPGFSTAAHPIRSQIWDADPEKTDHSDCRKSGKFTVVDISQTSARKQHSDSGTCFQHYNPNRCILSWVGSSVSRHENWRPLEQRRATSSHKHSGTESGLSGHSILSESMSTDRESYSSTNGQHDGCGIYQQTRRNEIEQVNSVSLGYMELMSVNEDNSAPTRNSEHQSRCRVETHKQQDRMDTRQTTVRKYPEMLLQATSRYLCFQTEPPTTVVPSTSSGPRGNGGRCVHNGLESVDIIHIHPPIILLNRVLLKLRLDKATALVIAPTWTAQPWYPMLLEMLVEFPALLPTWKKTIFLPFNKEAVHPLWKTLALAVWPLSGDNNRLFRNGVRHPHGIMEDQYQETVRRPLEDLGWLVW